MNHFSKNELLKLHGGGKSLIGGYQIDSSILPFKTLNNPENNNLDNNKVSSMFDGSLIVPALFYNKQYNMQPNLLTYEDKYNYLEESLHNKLLGLLNKGKLSRKNRTINKKTRKRH
jgi:hypothetical protein